jgi:hypothetical protein
MGDQDSVLTFVPVPWGAGAGACAGGSGEGAHTPAPSCAGWLGTSAHVALCVCVSVCSQHCVCSIDQHNQAVARWCRSGSERRSGGAHAARDTPGGDRRQPASHMPSDRRAVAPFTAEPYIPVQHTCISDVVLHDYFPAIDHTVHAVPGGDSWELWDPRNVQHKQAVMDSSAKFVGAFIGDAKARGAPRRPQHSQTRLPIGYPQP